jgi:uncharacterized protein
MDVLDKHLNDLSAFCKANRIKKLSLFGSYIDDSNTEESDVDLLVEFEGNTGYGLLDIARIERELSEIIGKKVDLRTSEELSRYFRNDIIKESRVKYEG